MDLLPQTPTHATTPFSYSFDSYSCGAVAVVSSAQSVRQGKSDVLPPKPKQSKSRNGCNTCKAKRLKCDETKPTCQQCTRRGVPCGGYKKDFKWRPFEETSIASRVSKPAKKAPKKKASPRSVPLTTSEHLERAEEAENGIIAPQTLVDTPLNTVIISVEIHLPSPPQTESSLGFEDRWCKFDNGLFSDSSSVSSSITSPRMEDFSTTDSDVDLCSFDLQAIDSDPYGLHGVFSPALTGVGVDECIGDVILADHRLAQDWQLFLPDTLSTRSNSQDDKLISLFDTFRRPRVAIDSSEIILAHFDKKTCGIMSIKDGPTENPWRTLIWPMAQNTPALYHAISAMSAFHMSQERPQIRVEGMDHMRKSVRFLAQGLSHGNIDYDAALATTLVLAFSEAFDRHTSTGIEHLRGAKILVNQALAKSNTLEDASSMRRFRFVYNVWVYLNVLARLTSKAEDDIRTPSLYGPLPYVAEVDPLLGCASTLFPLIGRAASIAQLVRSSTKNPISLISEASDLQVELENWTPEVYYEPIEDATNDVFHCIQTAYAYRWAALLYLHQAVPELPSLKAHNLAEKVMGLLASVPMSSRSCIVHIFPLLAAGCEAVGCEREWVQSRWEGMANRMRIGNVIKAWQVTQEVWERRDAFNAKNTTRPERVLSLSPKSSRSSSLVAGIYSISVDPELRRWDTASMATSESPSRGINGSSCSDYSHGRVISACTKGSFQDMQEYEFSLRGGLHWMSVMAEWSWEVLLG